MMGKEESKNSKLFWGFDIGSRVPEDHLLRKLNRVLDLKFLYESVADTYGRNGNVSVPPPVIMKMLLLLSLYNVRSERELMETIPMRLDWMWFLGYDIDDEVPNHSVLSKARKRWGAEVFKELFRRVLQQAVAASMVEGRKFFVDASLVRADASNDSVKTRAALELDPEKYAELIARLDERENEPRPNGGKYERKNDGHISTTDPEATIVSRQHKNAELTYKVHRSTDAKHEIVTTCEMTTGAENEADVLGKQIEAFRNDTGMNPEVVIADSKYGTKQNFAELKEKGYTTHMNDLSDSRKTAIKRDYGIYEKEAFTYDAERDVYICPAGKELVRRSRNPLRGWINYNASRLDCDACPLKPQCTRSKTGRTINRFEEDDILAAARKEAHSDASRKDLKQRQELMERSFAYSVRFGYKRARYRGLWRVYIQQLVIATVQNLIRMARHLFPTPNGGPAIGSSLDLLLAFLTTIIASVALLIRSEPIRWRLALDEKLCRAT